MRFKQIVLMKWKRSGEDENDKRRTPAPNSLRVSRHQTLTHDITSFGRSVKALLQLATGAI